ncbi:hypothetical protein [Pararhizobium sp. PWRC1-1]|uniref:hypothetical protein n=1 Tax=Pararhizobium sp. PWRC1-1 TaxID=2804566 RepID=UPI003CEB45C1
MTVFVAFIAAIAVLFLTLAGVGEHAPSLHSTMAAVSSESHVHGHSHDDFDLVDVSSDDLSDHHHADHTHDKAGLVTALGLGYRLRSAPAYPVTSESVADGPPYGIRRPPRTVTLI